MRRFAALTIVTAATVIISMGAEPAAAGGPWRYGPPAPWGYAAPARHGYPGPYGYGWAPPRVHRVWIAESINIRGARYVGRGPEAWVATRRALKKCSRDSVLPFGCRVVEVRKIRRRWGCLMP
jgi:hypothetical protein